MSRNKISTTVYITQEQSDKLRLLHDRTKVPVEVRADSVAEATSQAESREF